MNTLSLIISAISLCVSLSLGAIEIWKFLFHLRALDPIIVSAPPEKACCLIELTLVNASAVPLSITGASISVQGQKVHNMRRIFAYTKSPDLLALSTLLPFNLGPYHAGRIAFSFPSEPALQDLAQALNSQEPSSLIPVSICIESGRKTKNFQLEFEIIDRNEYVRHRVARKKASK